MDSQVIPHWEAIVDVEIADAKSALETNLYKSYAEFAAHGRLKSGATIRNAIRIFSEMAKQSLARLETSLAELPGQLDRPALLRSGVSRLLCIFEGELPEVIKVAGGGPEDRALFDATSAMYADFQADIERHCTLASFRVTQTTSKDAVPASAAIQTSNSKAGRPAAEFWDAMWAEICRQLYVGDLQPKRQADLESAMLTWIENAGHSAATSTVRARARLVWDAISSEP